MHTRFERSEVVELLVGVVIRRLEQHLLRLLGQLVLLVQLDTVLHSLNVALLCAQVTLLNHLLFNLFGSLEVNLGLQVASGVVAAYTFRFRQVAWSVRAGLVLKESVWMSRLRAESGRWHQFYN